MLNLDNEPQSLAAWQACKEQASSGLSIWQRGTRPQLQEAMRNWLRSNAQSLRAELDSDHDKSELLRLAQTIAPDCPDTAAMLYEEFRSLCALFFHETQALRLDFYLQIVRDNLCTRWHADYNRYRLLCTYLGPGTLWTPALNVSWRGTKIHSILDPEQIQQAQNFDVLLLRGRHHPEMLGRGLVHRSPELSAEQPLRLLLKIDAL